MAFKMKGFPMHKGISPMRQSSSNPSSANYVPPATTDNTTNTTPPNGDEEKAVEEEESGTSAGDLSNIMKTHFNDKDKKIKTSNGKKCTQTHGRIAGLVISWKL